MITHPYKPLSVIVQWSAMICNPLMMDIEFYDGSQWCLWLDDDIVRPALGIPVSTTVCIGRSIGDSPLLTNSMLDTIEQLYSNQEIVHIVGKY